MESSLPYSSGTSKRAKAPISQTAHCLVDGCTADLNLCRDYHRRHKVCEAHSKTPLVTISGREQRFCQQCSRFHSLAEFDEGKRSCRKRLDGHNRRRRKPHPDARTAPQGLIFSAQQQSMPTARLLSFTSPSQLLPNSSWPGVVKPDQHEMSMYQQQQQLSYVERPIQFGGGDFHHEHTFVVDPNISRDHRALSLLSSSSSAVQTGNESVFPPHHHHVLSNHVYYTTTGGGSSATTGLGNYANYLQEIKPMSSASVNSHSSNSSTLHFPEMFQPAPEGSSTGGGGSHQTLTFTWE